MLVIMTDGRWPVLKCPSCNTTFHGPAAQVYKEAHVADKTQYCLGKEMP